MTEQHKKKNTRHKNHVVETADSDKKFMEKYKEKFMQKLLKTIHM